MSFTKKRKSSEDNYDSEEDSISDSDYTDESSKLRKNTKVYTILKRIKNEIIKVEPNINNILEQPMLECDRIKLFQMYEIYKNLTPNTEEWLKYRTQLIQLYDNCIEDYKNYQDFSEDKKKLFNEELNNILNYKSEQTSMRYKILSLNTSLENKVMIYKKYENFLEMTTDDSDYAKNQTWLDYAVNLPYDNIKTLQYQNEGLTKFLKNVYKKLDRELYGMKTVKEQILIFLNSKILNPSIKKCNLGLIGEPGVGKTRLATLLASILDYPFEQISFGGVTNAEYIKGHNPAYIGSKPGELLKCLRRMKYKNGILLFDEYEKISDNKDICSSLLHITDPTQNSTYRDNYLPEITCDLSNIFFIYSMNSPPEDKALKDRIFFINVPGYNNIEKIIIIEKYLIPTTLKNLGIKIGSIKMGNGVSEYIINKVCIDSDTGIRTIEKTMLNIFNKINFLVCHQDNNGELKDFDITFNINKKITYPLVLTKNIVDKLLN